MATPLFAPPTADGTDAQEIGSEVEVEDQVGFINLAEYVKNKILNCYDQFTYA